MDAIRRAAARAAGLWAAARRGGGVAGDVAGEAPPGWYDALYRGSEAYRLPYRKSHYYFSWCLIADRLRRAGWPRVLEVGCGPGQLAALLADQGLPRAGYAGFDFSPEAVRMAAGSLGADRVWLGDARDPANYRRSAFDAVVCTEVLEHVEDDLAVVANWPPGTLVVATVPSFDYPSHVRTFADADAVRARYAPAFAGGLDVAAWPSPRGEPGDRFFLLQGVRRP